jgi:carbamoyl-phosphate synthase small subunit
MITASKQNLNACLVLADGSVFWGHGFGATGTTVAELCFNTSMTGYQEIMTDPSYSDQIVTFTFPHVGNTGVTSEDNEASKPHAAGMVVKWDPTKASNWRAQGELALWLKSHNRIAIGGIDTRRLTRIIRLNGSPHAALCYSEKGFDIENLLGQARQFVGLEGIDLAKDVTCTKPYKWKEKKWSWSEGYRTENVPKYSVVAIDYGAKHNILRCLAPLDVILQCYHHTLLLKKSLNTILTVFFCQMGQATQPQPARTRFRLLNLY